MPTLRKTVDDNVVALSTTDKPVDALLTTEWLLTNARGGYAASTVIGCNTRRYHGLLVGSLNPLANRMMALAGCLEMVIVDGKALNLSTFEFNDKLAPEGFMHLKQFRQNGGVHFDYQLQDTPLGPRPSRAGLAALLARHSKPNSAAQITKSVYLLRQRDTVALAYDFRRLRTTAKSIEFVLRPFVGLRDFHSLQKSYARLYSQQTDDALLVGHEPDAGCQLALNCPAMTFRKDPQWWFNFVYRHDRQRGQDFTEDLWSPGFFKCRLTEPAKIVFWAALCPPRPNGFAGKNQRTQCQAPNPQYDIDAVARELRTFQQDLRRKANNARPLARDKRYHVLCRAADQFIAYRATNGELAHKQQYSRPGQKKTRATVLAGFPWFADWGRDTFIALPGLLLATGRLEQAKSVLTTFAAAADEGMIPNRFDDYSDTAYFNSIDASLWFIHAAFEYLAATKDSQTFTQHLLPTIRWIIDAYYNGTRFGIRADDDALITGGNEETQLTWMDAKYEGVTFTPRYGKAVEINALWYNSLCRLAQFYTDRNIKTAEHFKNLSGRVAASFVKAFWNDNTRYLNDCVLPDGTVDSSLRPNQILAVSLPNSALSPAQQRSVLEIVQEHLLTPYGLRTLNTADSRYKGRYDGPQSQRDEAYHQGTVWPYLIGPFIQAFLKVNGPSRKTRRKCAEFIEPLMQHLTDQGCLGQLAEIFDGDPPHQPKGCFAQAWSVAELIRAYQLINS
ncbi:MAG: amylo-alpha-1,6-glucosidase [Planctomycetota bacterium]